MYVQSETWMNEVRVTRRQHQSCCKDRYKDVCVVIDDITDVSLCTTGSYGEPLLEGEDVVFRFTKRLATKVS